MKSIRPLLYFLCSAFIFLLTSCNGGGSSDLIKYASAEDLIVIRGNLSTLLQNADCKIEKDGIEFSSAIERLLRQDRDAAEALHILAEAKGVDYSDMILVVNPQGDVLIGNGLKDAKTFKAWLEEVAEDYGYDFDSVEDEEGYRIYKIDHDFSVFVDKSAVFLAITGYRTKSYEIDFINSFLEKAKQSPLEDWKIDMLSKGNLANVAVNLHPIERLMKKEGDTSFADMPAISAAFDIKEVKDGCVIANMNLDNNTVKIEFTGYNAEGKKLANKMQGLTVDTSLLKYVHKDYSMAMLLAVPQDVDWDNFFMELHNMMHERYYSSDYKEAIEILESIDGSVMAAVKIIDLKNFDEDNPMSYMDFVAAAQLKPGKAQSILNQTKDNIESQNRELINNGWGEYAVKYEADQSSLAVQIESNFTMYLTVDDNNLVVSNMPPKKHDSDSFKTDGFTGSTFAVVGNVTKSSLQQAGISIPFGVKANIKSQDASFEMSIDLTECNGTLLDNVLSFIAGQI